MYYVVLYTRCRCMCCMSGVGECITWCCMSGVGECIAWCCMSGVVVWV